MTIQKKKRQHKKTRNPKVPGRNYNYGYHALQTAQREKHYVMSWRQLWYQEQTTIGSTDGKEMNRQDTRRLFVSNTKVASPLRPVTMDGRNVFHHTTLPQTESYLSRQPGPLGAH
jgi:hypothetical protein